MHNDINEYTLREELKIYYSPQRLLKIKLLLWLNYVITIIIFECLSLAPVSDSDVFKTIKLLRPFKSVGVDDIPSFIIKGCTDISVPVLKTYFKSKLISAVFSYPMEATSFVPVLEKGNSASFSNFRPISLLNNFSKLFKFVIHGHVSH
jgi:hypothetical protein